MAKKETQFKKVSTPIGKSMWTKLAQPETRWATATDPEYKQGGYFEACVQFTGDESAPLRALITKMHEANLNEAWLTLLMFAILTIKLTTSFQRLAMALSSN